MAFQSAPQPLKVEEFFGAVDARTPLFRRDPGWLKTCQNMRSKANGHLEARGGFDPLKPSGGTSGAIDTQGIMLGFHEQIRTYGSIFLGVSETTFSADLGGLHTVHLFSNATNLSPGVAAYPEITSNATTSAIYFIAGQKFSRFLFNLIQGTGGTYTVQWQYWNAAWTALPSPAPTEDFKTSGVKEVQFSVPSDGIPKSVNGVYGYAVRCQITVAAASTNPAIHASTTGILSDWPGRRILWGASGAAELGPANGKVRSYGQTTGGVGSFNDVFPGSATLFSGNYARYRFATFQDTLVFVNGFEQKRFDGTVARNIGFLAPTPVAPTVLASANANNFGRACVFGYAVSFGYGPGGSWGEGPMVTIKDAFGVFIARAFGAGDQALIDISISNTLGAANDIGQVGALYLYRTNDLTGVDTSARPNQPFYRLVARYPQDPGGLSFTGAGAVTDYSYALPFPSFPGSVVDFTPPSRCRFVHSFRGRMLLASNDRFPSRGWWSQVIGDRGGECFDQAEDFVDLSYNGGGGITGSEVAFDTWFLSNEKGVVGVSDLDEDIPNVFEVEGAVPCIAPDAMKARYGVLMYPSYDGIYMVTWDGLHFRSQKVSDDQTVTFGRMTIESHGGSRAAMYDTMYDIQLQDRAGNAIAGGHWRFDIAKWFATGGKAQCWNSSTVALSPFCEISAPLGHADAGVPHPVFANTNPAVADRTPVVGEYTTADSGTGFDCIADVHFGPPGTALYQAKKAQFYYQSDAGWGTPTITAPPGQSAINKEPDFGTLTKVPAEFQGTDYKLAVCDISPGSGAQDIVVRFKATTVAGGLAKNQRLIAGYLKGNAAELPQV